MSGSRCTDASTSDCDQASSSPSVPFLVGVRDGYERWAPTYDLFPNPLLAREQRHLLPLLPHLRNRCALDLACGTGRWLEHLVAVGARPGAGVDLSYAMLRIGGAKKGLSGKTVQADCLRLPFSTSTFDFSICSFALGHVQDLRGVAAEFSRVMKRDSNLFVTDLHPEAYAMGWRTGFRDRQSAVHVQTLPHSAAEILEAFGSAGCECVACHSLNLENSEQHLFTAAGKEDLFPAACRVPAILFCHFKRVSANRGLS